MPPVSGLIRRPLTTDRAIFSRPCIAQPRTFGRLRWACSLLLIGALSACSADKVGGLSDGDEAVEADDSDDSDEKADAGKDSGKGNIKDAGSNSNDEPEDDDDDDDKKGDDEPEQCAAIREDAPPGKGGVDVVFLVDTSGSMLHAITQVVTNVATFIDSFENTNVDTRVIMITRDDPAAGKPVASDKDKYLFIRSEVDSQALFGTAIQHFPDYKDFLRPNAVTQFVMVTDDDDRMAGAEFKQQMRALLGRDFTQHAIASESVNGLPCISEAQLWNPLCVAPIPAVCAAMRVGMNYYSLADDTAGVKMSICKADWTDVFKELQKAVIEAVPLPCDYPLTEASMQPDFDPLQVSIVYEAVGEKEQSFPKAMTPDRCGDNLGWHYDDNANPGTITLCPAACELVQKGGSIDIAFGCEPEMYL